MQLIQHKRFIKSQRPLVKGALALLVISVALVAPAAWSLDFFDLYGFVSQLQSRLAGYRLRTVRFDYLGERCSIPILEHVAAPGTKRLLLLHGFGDSRVSLERFASRSQELGLPHQSYLILDWPRHGGAQCDQVKNLDQAADAIAFAVRELERLDPKGRQVSALIGTSLGVAMSAVLHSTYPDARLYWIAPPVLEDAALVELITGIRNIKDEAGAREFMGRVITNRETQIPDFLIGGILKRIKRAQPLLAELDRPRLRAQVLAIDPEQVQILTGKLDRLTPPLKLDPEFKARFGSRIRELPTCGHDMGRACDSEVIRALASDSVN